MITKLRIPPFFGGAGESARSGEPIGNSWVSTLKILIIALSPAMAALWAPIHLSTPAPAGALACRGWFSWG